jgi:hypothetical protein
MGNQSVSLFRAVQGERVFRVIPVQCRIEARPDRNNVDMRKHVSPRNELLLVPRVGASIRFCLIAKTGCYRRNGGANVPLRHFDFQPFS